MKRLIVLMFGLIALSGCVEHEEYMARPPSGRAEVAFASRNPAKVAEKITARCAAKGLLVRKTSPNEVICGGTMSGGDAVLAQIAIGNSYSTAPEQYIRFTIFPVNGQVRVQTYQWIETQMAFGQVNKLELNSGKHFNDTLRSLIALGGRPITTTTPPQKYPSPPP